MHFLSLTNGEKKHDESIKNLTFPLNLMENRNDEKLLLTAYLNKEKINYLIIFLMSL